MYRRNDCFTDDPLGCRSLLRDSLMTIVFTLLSSSFYVEDCRRVITGLGCMALEEHFLDH